MTHALLLLLLALSLPACGKYGRPTRMAAHPGPPATSAAPAPAEECDDEKTTEPEAGAPEATPPAPETKPETTP